jgi:DNA-binding PadR family transcriptional regulator
MWPMMAMMGGRHRRWGGGFGGGHGNSDWSGGGRRERGRMFAGGELRLLLLKLIGDETRHGYELIKAIDELTGGNYAPSPGIVYPTLSLLLDEGMIEERADATPRKAFAITDQGEIELSERSEEADALIARLIALNEDEAVDSAPPLRRAMGNLFTAVRHRVASGDLDRDTVHAIADLLDEAARKIERL